MNNIGKRDAVTLSFITVAAGKVCVCTVLHQKCTKIETLKNTLLKFFESMTYLVKYLKNFANKTVQLGEKRDIDFYKKEDFNRVEEGNWDGRIESEDRDDYDDNYELKIKNEIEVKSGHVKEGHKHRPR